MAKQILFAFILWCLTSTGPVQAGDNASWSYTRLYELLYQFQTLPAEQTRDLDFRVRLKSRGTVPDDVLEVFIQRGERRIPVPVDSFGILELPISPQLGQENPRVVANWPKRNLGMGLAVLIRQPKNGELDGQWLQDAVMQTNSALLARARVAPERVPQARGVTLMFDPDFKAAVTVQDGKAERFDADENGSVNISLNDAGPKATLIIEGELLVIFPWF